MTFESDYFNNNESDLRKAIEQISNRLCSSVSGTFDFKVEPTIQDESIDKLVLLINFVIEAARRNVDELRKKNVTLSEVDQLKSRFLANISHELKTPLALILGPVEQLLADENLKSDQAEKLAVIRRNALTLLKNVNEILDITKLEAGKMDLLYCEADISELVRASASHFNILAHEKGIHLDVDVPDKLIAQVDPEKIQRILLNLLSNAFKYTPEGGIISCKLLRDEMDFVLALEDTGPGIKRTQREVIFERFKQAEERPAHRKGGTGLGLAIVKDIVSLHHGTISVSNAPKHGAIFKIRLPIKAPAQTKVTKEYDTQPPEMNEILLQGTLEELKPLRKAPAVISKKHTPAVLLLVEDNIEMNRFSAEVLNKHFKVVTAFDGKDGFRKAQKLKPDLIITDIMMPKMSGDQLVYQLRASPEFNSIPIILLSARTDDDLRIQLLKGGAQDFIMKPFFPEELVARVMNWMEIKQAQDVLKKEVATQSSNLVEMAQELALRKNQLESSLEIAELARIEALKASRAKSDLITLVSHELKTPLTSVLANLQVFGRMRGNEMHQQKLIEKISRSSASLATLIDSLLEYSRLDQGNLVLHLQNIDLNEIVKNAIEELHTEAQEKNITLELHISEDMTPLRTDRTMIEIILKNLLSNAIKFTEKGRIQIKVNCSGLQHEVVVHDTGIGISSEDQAKIFEAFEQLQSVEHKSIKGVGLGLSLVKQAVKALGGSIELRSQPGTGSQFTIKLPSHHFSAEENEAMVA